MDPCALQSQTEAIDTLSLSLSLSLCITSGSFSVGLIFQLHSSCWKIFILGVEAN